MHIYIYNNIFVYNASFPKINICTRNIWHTEKYKHLVYNIDILKTMTSLPIRATHHSIYEDNWTRNASEILKGTLNITDVLATRS